MLHEEQNIYLHIQRHTRKFTFPDSHMSAKNVVSCTNVFNFWFSLLLMVVLLRLKPRLYIPCYLPYSWCYTNNFCTYELNHEATLVINFMIQFQFHASFVLCLEEEHDKEMQKMHSSELVCGVTGFFLFRLQIRQRIMPKKKKQEE